MRRLIWGMAVLVCPACLLTATQAQARGSAYGWCEQGNVRVTVPGGSASSPKYYQQSIPASTVTVYLAGTTTLASIYSDNAGTVKANPFTCPTTSTPAGFWSFYANDGSYDVRSSGTGVPTPFTIGSVMLIDPARVGNVRWCDAFAGATIGVRIAAAIADLPTVGGTVICSSQTGAESIIATLTINKPVWLQLGAMSLSCNAAPCIAVTGQASQATRITGTGKTYLQIVDDVACYGTCLKNISTTGNVIEVNLGSTTNLLLGGVALEDFTILGNRNVGGAASGSGIVLFGGTDNSGGALADVSITRVTSRLNYEHGLDVRNRVFEVSYNDSAFLENRLDGISLTDPSGITNGPIINQFSCYHSMIDGNGRDGYRSLSANVGGFSWFYGCNISNSGGWGFNSTGQGMFAYGTNIELNTTGGVQLNGAAGSYLSGIFGQQAGATDISLIGTTKQVVIDACRFGNAATTQINIANTSNGNVIGNCSPAPAVITDANTSTVYRGMENIGSNGRFVFVGTGGAFASTFSTDMINASANNGPTITTSDPTGAANARVWSISPFNSIWQVNTFLDNLSGGVQRLGVTRTGVLHIGSDGGVGGVYNDSGGFKHMRVSFSGGSSCAAGGCEITVTWSTAFADTNYTMNCSVEDVTAQAETTGLRFAKINTKLAGSVTVDLDNLSVGALAGTIDCIAVHN